MLFLRISFSVCFVCTSSIAFTVILNQSSARKRSSFHCHQNGIIFFLFAKEKPEPNGFALCLFASVLQMVSGFGKLFVFNLVVIHIDVEIFVDASTFQKVPAN